MATMKHSDLLSAIENALPDNVEILECTGIMERSKDAVPYSKHPDGGVFAVFSGSLIVRGCDLENR